MLPKIPTPAKENSRAWVWDLQQNIMGLSFEHTQLILKYTQQYFFLLFSTNLIYAEFDSLRALKKEVAKDD